MLKVKRNINIVFTILFFCTKIRDNFHLKVKILKDIEDKKILIITLKTIFGLEEVLSDELKELGYLNYTILNRAVQVKGTWKDVYYLNLHLRCAISVLVQVNRFKIRTEKDLYNKALQIDWTSYFDVDKTFAVKGAVFSDIFKHTQYPFFLIKDAIVDKFRSVYNRRPNVNVKSPQVLFDVYINNNEVVVSLNTSGAPLFQRGYRDQIGEAPLNEVVAAGLIRMSGWDRKSPLIDVFCGSGTILIEAALLASGIPSVVERNHFAFKNLINYNNELWTEILDKSIKYVKEFPCKISGSDIDSQMVLKARRNLGKLSVGRFVDISLCSFDEVRKDVDVGILISNPPYGKRMGDDINLMYSKLGDWMKREMQGFNCWILSSNIEAYKDLGLKPNKKIKVFNGDLECSFRNYSIYAGSKKAKFQD